MKIINRYRETISDGVGFRYSIYFSGCGHFCQGCHNPSTWKGDVGEEVSLGMLVEMVAEINANPLLSGITLSGGDPFYNTEELLWFLKTINKLTKSSINVWCYTGYTFEEIMKMPNGRLILSMIDILVDGKFEEDERNPDLLFRGSNNQRLVKVKKSILQGEVVTLDL